jgi:hypothetical protein
MKPNRDPEYLRWIRSLPCLVCGSTRYIEAAHTGPHGLGQKSPDSSAVPLCTRHHRTGNDSYHKLGPRQFCHVHNLELSAIVKELSVKPRIRVVNGCFVGQVENESLVLGSMETGLNFAVRKMIILRRTAARESIDRKLRKLC